MKMFPLVLNADGQLEIFFGFRHLTPDQLEPPLEVEPQKSLKTSDRLFFYRPRHQSQGFATLVWLQIIKISKILHTWGNSFFRFSISSLHKSQLGSPIPNMQIMIRFQHSRRIEHIGDRKVSVILDPTLSLEIPDSYKDSPFQSRRQIHIWVDH